MIPKYVSVSLVSGSLVSLFPSSPRLSGGGREGASGYHRKNSLHQERRQVGFVEDANQVRHLALQGGGQTEDRQKVRELDSSRRPRCPDSRKRWRGRGESATKVSGYRLLICGDRSLISIYRLLICKDRFLLSAYQPLICKDRILISVYRLPICKDRLSISVYRFLICKDQLLISRDQLSICRDQLSIS
jgi:hypothetical protein